MDVKLFLTENYERSLTQIEDFLFEAADQDPYVIEWLHKEHDKALSFLKQNYTVPAIHPTTGDQSWPFADGRFRLFFKFVENQGSKFTTIYLVHLIDNRQANLDIYPNNSIPTYLEDEY